MELRLRIILLVFSSLGLILITHLVKKLRLELKYALLWIAISILFILLAVNPFIADFIAEILGIKTPSNAVYLLGIISLLMITFSLTISLSRMSNRIKDISQEIGLMGQELETLKESTKDSKDN